MIGAMSGVGQDVPPYVTAVASRPQKGPALYGLNLIGLKRNRFPEETIASLKLAFKILFRSDTPLKDSLARAEAELPPLPEVRHMIEFVRSSKRGVLR
jgi:UDP-N-acetylglucosamine acyltransferase